MSFENAAVLWLLLGVAWYGYKRFRSLTTIATPAGPLQTEGEQKSLRLWSMVAIETALLLLLVVALAGPYKVQERSLIKDEGVDIVFALDVSASMQAADFPPNRLEALKKLTKEFVNRSGSNRICVLIFAKHVFSQSPLTTDHSILHYLIDGISYESIDHYVSGGTAIGDGLIGAVDTLGRFKMKGRDQAIILISDGESESGVDPLIAAKLVREKKIRLYTIGVGGDKAVAVSVYGKPFISTNNQVLKTKLDDAQLKAITKTAGGRYWRAKNMDVLTNIFEELSKLEKTPIEIETTQQKQSITPGLALLSLVAFGGLLLFQAFFVRNPLR